MRWSKPAMLLSVLALVSMGASVRAAPDEYAGLVALLQRGGLVIVMRHANSPLQPPDAATANPDNPGRERQLDEAGRRDATQMGEALRRLRIPVEEVLSSPTYRARETAKLMGFADARAVEQLGNEGMQAAGADRAAWLRNEANRTTRGGNRILITHGPNVSAAFAEYSAGMSEGEALIFDPRGPQGAVMVQRIKIGVWDKL